MSDEGTEAFRDPEITMIYGRDTCEDTMRAIARFDAAGRVYRYVRIDIDTETRDRLHAQGLTATPVIVTPAGAVSMEPDDEGLARIIAATA